MIAYSQKELTIRKTFNISEANAASMTRLLSPRKQTEFVNQALARELARIEQQQRLESLSAKIKAIKRIKAHEPVLSTIDNIRNTRDAELSQAVAQ